MDKVKLKDILSSAFDLEQWKNILIEMFPKVEFFTHINHITHDMVNEGGQTGIIRLDDGRSVAIYTFEVKDNVLIGRNRKGLHDIAAKTIDQSIIHGALAFYYSKKLPDYRLTFIAKQTSFNEDGELIKSETAPKRYTFLLGENESCRTAADRLSELVFKKEKGDSISLADVTEAFSVERLNKEFFAGYKAQYNKFLRQLSDTKQNRDYVKKLLGRLVFLQFLQKKGWMGVPASHSDWNGGDKNYLMHLIQRYEGNDHLLSDVLEPLFFDTLNNGERKDDVADIRLGDNIKIPYLNGGLFEKDDIDELGIDFPYSDFKELMEFFAMYNFTIDENDPDDSEVGIDPEMLGHIFENLLEDNKDKGAFYTPKEIVQYMCRQSIIQYLKTHEPGEQYAESIGQLINNGIVMPELQSKSVASRFMQLLKDVKVCDPAIGSGAFPMGILYVLYHAIHHLQSHAEPHGNFDSTQTKRDIIQNNIFGVDIEQGAVDIARLRFWLALVVDAEEPQPLPNLDYKITCGNSLLSRYPIDAPIENVFIEYNKGKSESEKITLSKYKELVRNYTDTSNHETKTEFRQTIEAIKSAFKTELSRQEKESISKLKGKILALKSPMLLGERTQKEKTELKKLKEQLIQKEELQANIINNRLYADAFEWRFEFPSLLDEKGNFTGFDIIIGNPPYLRIQGIRDVNPLFADELVKKYQSATGSFDLYVTFVERGLQIIKQQGIVNYIMPVKWTNAAFGKGLRTIISGNNAAHQIINFGAYQVFNASTYTALQWFRIGSNELLYYELDKDLATNQELDSYLRSLKKEKASEIKSDKFNNEAWILTVGYTTSILEKLESNSRCIGDIFAKIFQGIATGKDDVYFLYDCTEESDFVYGYSKQLGCQVCIERGLVKPLLKGEDVHRYDHISTNRFVIFPYKLENGKAIIYTEKELGDLFPKGYNYLKRCEEFLRARENGRFNIDGEWFQYSRKQGILFAEFEKLVAPEISLGGSFAYDQFGEFYSTTKIYGYIRKENVKEGYKFWLALFNSRLFWFYIKNTGYVLRGGYYTFKTNYVSPFPVPEFQQTSKGEKIVERLTDFLLFLYDKNNADILTHTSNKRLATYIEEIIDMIFYELYFEQHMKDNQIDVIADLNNYDWNDMSDAATIEAFYKWYQQSGNMVRQKIMLLDTRSNNFIYQIHRAATIYE